MKIASSFDRFHDRMHRLRSTRDPSRSSQHHRHADGVMKIVERRSHTMMELRQEAHPLETA
jgi:hypothetical protein